MFTNISAAALNNDVTNPISQSSVVIQDVFNRPLSFFCSAKYIITLH